MNIRNLLISTLMLTLAGCGCNTDSTPPGTTPPDLTSAVGKIKTQAPPIPVKPPTTTTPYKIDVTFVMDDSDNMNNKVLGIIPNHPGDMRTRSQAAQAIMRNIRANIEARFAMEWTANHPGQAVPPLDFAFAVARYEDFGGDFTDPTRRVGAVSSRENDMDARPFILNMPILREKHPQFLNRFLAAISRQAPGDGNPYFQQIARAPDPQTGIEALFQVAAPQNQDGSYGGFDADGNGNTDGSGLPTSQDPGLNPQTAPGATGDVPAVAFQAVADDADGQPQFQVTDAAGTPVTIPDPAGGAGSVPSYASGNLGGVGWRPNAARFVILASDFATVAPTDTVPTGTPPAAGILPPPGIGEMVTSTDGGMAAPRQARSVLLGAFDTPPQFLGGPTGLQITQRRLGVADGPVHDGGSGVAPVGAHTVQQAIDALNALNVEVLLIGTPQAGGLDTKPGDLGVNGDSASDIQSDLYDPTNPNTVQADLAPWFWMNSVNTLTTPPITSTPKPGRTTPSLFNGDDTKFWAVYNMGTVWPFDMSDPTGMNEGNILNTVTDDLAERIFDWVDNQYITAGTTAATRPALPTVTYTFSLQVFTTGVSNDIVQAGPLDAGNNPITLFTQDVAIPTYYSDDAAPGPVTVEFPLPTQADLTFVAASNSISLPAQATYQFKITAQLKEIGNQVMPPDPNPNTDQVDYIATYVKARGDGFTTGAGGGIVPLTSEFDPIVQADGSFTVHIYDVLSPGPGFVLSSLTQGGAIVNDETPGQVNADQAGGTLPWPPAPVPVP
jgi:hypothetical protein